MDNTNNQLSGILKGTEPISAEKLQALREQVGTLSDEDCQKLNKEIDDYVSTHKESLAQDARTEAALSALRQRLTERTATIRSTTEKLVGELSDVAKETAQTTARRGQALAYEEWKQITHPKNDWQTKAFHVLGVLSAGYLLYRAALWVKGKPDSGWMGRTLRFLGVSAIAGWALNRVGKGMEEKQEAAPPTPPSETPTEEKPVASVKPAKQAVKKPAVLKKKTVKTPVKERKPKEKVPAKIERAPASTILDGIVENQNLVGRGKLTIMMKGKAHTIEFKSDALFIDGLKYTITAIVFGPDQELTIMDVRKTGNIVSLKAGALIKEGTVQATAEELEHILLTLIKERTYKSTTDDGTEIVITKQMY